MRPFGAPQQALPIECKDQVGFGICTAFNELLIGWEVRRIRRQIPSKEGLSLPP